MATIQEKLSIPSITGVDIELPIAGPGGRSYAFVIDWHIRVLVSLAWAISGSYLYSGVVTLAPSLSDSGSLGRGYFFTVAAPAAAIYLLYHPVLELLMRGRTPGKRMAGIRIVTAAGATPDAAAILIRNVFRIVDQLPALYAVGLAATMLTDRAVRIGDLAAGTVLVYDEPRGEPLRFAEMSQGTAAKLGLARAEIVRDVLDRWDSLAPAARARLARSLLDLDGDDAPTTVETTVVADPATGALPADDAALRRRLTSLLG